MTCLITMQNGIGNAHHEIDCFFATTIGVTFDCLRPHFEEREISGMIISRRPNKTASSENAPAPSTASAIAITIASMIPNLAKSEFGTLGDVFNAKPTLANAAAILTIGVRNPIVSDTPITNVKAPMSQAPPDAGIPEAVRYSAPCAREIEATASRNRSRPKPGQPVGKVENSLRSPPPPPMHCSASKLRVAKWKSG